MIRNPSFEGRISQGAKNVGTWEAEWITCADQVRPDKLVEKLIKFGRKRGIDEFFFPIAYLADIDITGERGRGFGTIGIKEFERQSQERGAKTLLAAVLDADTPDDVLRHFYRMNGWTVIEKTCSCTEVDLAFKRTHKLAI